MLKRVRMQEQYVLDVLQNSMKNWNSEAPVFGNPVFDNVFEYVKYRFFREKSDWERKTSGLAGCLENWLQGLALPFEFMNYKILELKKEWGYETPDSKWLNGWWSGLANTILKLGRRSGVNFWI